LNTSEGQTKCSRQLTTIFNLLDHQNKEKKPSLIPTTGANLDDVDNLYDEDEEMHHTQEERLAKK